MKPAQNTEKEKHLKIIFKNMMDMESREVRTEILISDLEVLQKKTPEQRIDRNKDRTEENFFKQETYVCRREWSTRFQVNAVKRYPCQIYCGRI